MITSFASVALSLFVPNVSMSSEWLSNRLSEQFASFSKKLDICWYLFSFLPGWLDLLNFLTASRAGCFCNENGSMSMSSQMLKLSFNSSIFLNKVNIKLWKYYFIWLLIKNICGLKYEKETFWFIRNKEEKQSLIYAP